MLKITNTIEVGQEEILQILLQIQRVFMFANNTESTRYQAPVQRATEPAPTKREVQRAAKVEKFKKKYNYDEPVWERAVAALTAEGHAEAAAKVANYKNSVTGGKTGWDADFASWCTDEQYAIVWPNGGGPRTRGIRAD